MKKKYQVKGMTCAVCKRTVMNEAIKTKGVINASVNLANNTLDIEFDETFLDKNLYDNIKKAGYGLSDKISDDENKVLKRRVIISACFMVPLFYLACALMLKLPFPRYLLNDGILIYVFLQLFLLIPILVVNRRYYSSGFKKLFHLNPNMDTLIAIGSLSGFIYSLISLVYVILGVINNNDDYLGYVNNLYFDASGMILTLVTLGKYLEAKAKKKTGDAISDLVNMVPDMATLSNGESIRTSDIKIDDLIVVKPGDIIPTDGIIVSGEGLVDESLMSGESIPLSKGIDEGVVQGSVNQNGSFVFKATKTTGDTKLAKIINLVDEASNSKAPISRIADRVSLFFVPAILIVALITFIVWLFIDDVELAINMGISVLVISCPCALGLATPIAIMVAVGKGAKCGLIFKSASYLEALGKGKTICLDKTGTITYGHPFVTNVKCYIDETKFLSIIKSLEMNSLHPLSKAILDYTLEYNHLETMSFSSSGNGISAIIDKETYFGGNLEYISKIVDTKEITKELEEYAREGNSIIVFASQDKIIGYVTVADKIRESSIRAISLLKNHHVIMLTGDNELCARSIAKKVGIKDVYSNLHPDEKNDIIKANEKTIMVGDGVNDAIALKSAYVGVSMGGGANVAVDAGDVVLTHGDLMDLYNAIVLSKKTINNIKISLLWAFLYNLIALPIACGVLYYPLGIRLNPMIGALAMSLSSLCVVLNALRINRFKPKRMEENGMKEEITIEGMMCERCAKHVNDALASVPNVKKVEVILKKKKAVISFDILVDETLIDKKIKDAGYKVVKKKVL